MGWLWRAGIGVLAACGLAACTAPMDLPEVTQRAALDVGETAPIAFRGATSRIPRGTVVAEIPNIGSGVREWGCGRVGDATLEWSDRLAASWGGELGEIFYNTMQAAGYEVVGDPQQLFDRGDDRARARYQIGARLVELRGNFCQEVNMLWGTATRRVKGEFYAKVEWDIYSSAEHRVVERIVTEGVGRQQVPAYEGAIVTLQRAFESAAANLAADPAFRDRVAEAPPRPAATPKPADGAVALTGIRPSRRSMAQSVDAVLDAVVTVRTGAGHGSGFFISRDGYGLTNAHVVGDAETVMLRMRSGVEIEAKVLRRNKSRDVALFKAPVQVLRPLPLDLGGGLARLDEVYAVGTPIDFALQSSITKGVVGALRRVDEGRESLTYIQADAAIAPGNSGGPLLDARANVVGMSVSVWLFNGGVTGMNFFIPIADALDGLKVSVTPEGK